MLPNPWDVGSARLLRSVGFEALATSSAGHSFTLGRPDAVDSLSVDEVLEHVRSIVGATDLPVNVDFQDGYARDLDGLRDNVSACVDAGAAGLSIEDATGDASQPLYPFDDAVARVRAAREAIDAKGADVVLTGRAEGFLVGQPDLDAMIARLVAYSEVGADCLYAPGLTTIEQVEAVVASVAPKPVNVLLSRPGFTTSELANAGVRRISIGSAFARIALGAFLDAARQVYEEGCLSTSGVSFGELNDLFQ